MHSRKSIFYKGIIFVLSFFAMAVFTNANVNAADCKVEFLDGNQYLTVGGDQSKWQDSGALNVIGNDCSDIEVTSITVNGVAQSETVTKFSLASKAAGHYSVGYNYTYAKAGEAERVSGTIYRYIRVLNGEFDTSNNYTLASFSQTGSVIDSFDIDNNHFASFVITNSDTYIVIKDVLGRDIASYVIKDGSGNGIVATKVLKDDNGYFYIVANDSEGNGVIYSYNITPSGDTYDFSYVIDNKNTQANYNKAYYSDGVLYIAGRTKTGYPYVGVYDGSLQSYTYENKKGELLGISYKDNTIYAVGYLKDDNSNIKSDLFIYITNNTLQEVDVLKDNPNTISNTVFNDVIFTTDGLFIVGETNLVDINANGNYTSNTDSSYSDALLLKVSFDGTVLLNAKMLGTSKDDSFTKIGKYDATTYYLIGMQNNNNASLVYTFDDEFKPVEHITNGSSAYVVNGLFKWTYGDIYFGKITPSTKEVLGVYYVGNSSTSTTPLFISLDSRNFNDTNSWNLIQDNKYAICDYKISYGTGEYKSISCDESIITPPTDESDENYYKYYINTTTIGKEQRLNYQIASQTGATILVYKTINVTKESVAIDLKKENQKTGILRWYVYNRPYTYSVSNAIRLDSESFNYSSTETIESIIEQFVKTGTTPASVLRGIANVPQVGEVYNTFNKHKQNSAAFASIEYAKQFAYYLEFSRVVRVEGQLVDDLGAIRYATPSSGTSIKDGSSFYIYYIDYRGNSGSNLLAECSVAPNAISNCSNKGGYAFANLNDIRIVIENMLRYNNYFVSTRNTIYNGSIPESSLPLYHQEMYTTQYLSRVGFESPQNDLTINVEKNGEVIYSGKNKNVYFGGTLDGTTYKYGNLTLQVTPVEGKEYYQTSDEKYVVFIRDACYKVYYTFVKTGGEISSTGTAREFCLDTTAPTIVYTKDGSSMNSTHTASSITGGSAENPTFIGKSFTIAGLDDLDPYSFIVVNGNRYPLACSDNSETCINDRLQYIFKRFEYNKNNIRQVLSVTFYDRLENKNTFYFVIGTNSPSISVTNQSDDSFTLVIDFYNTNPIITASALVVPQSCSGISDGCYTPDSSDIEQRPITTNTAEFKDALLNYILAVSYRDNELAKHEIITTKEEEGLYTINGISYAIENGRFVEKKGYGEPISIDSYNMFEYNGKKYIYDETTTGIYHTMVDSFGSYVIDPDMDPIPLYNDNWFKFDLSSLRIYQIIEENDNLIVRPLPIERDIRNNKVMLDELELTIDYVNRTVSYTNPELGQLKHIEITFKRTTEVNGVITPGAGVDIPATEQILDGNKRPVVDPITNQNAYRILDDKYIHFDLVDGSYTFTITENFAPHSHSVKADINVVDLEMHLGVAKQNYENPLVLTDKTQYDFDIDQDEGAFIALRRLGGADNYPLQPSIIQDSNLTDYRDTYFVDRAFYMGIKYGGNSVLIIKIYNNLNEYGIPFNSTSCKALVIYGALYTIAPDIRENVGCGSNISIVKYEDLNNSILAEYGVQRIVDDNATDPAFNSGFFGFNQEFTFYEITFTSYEYREGVYVEPVNPITHHVYIDTVGPNDEDDAGITKNSITPKVYRAGSEDPNYEYEYNEGRWVLNSVVGANSDVRFTVNYKTGSANDFRENKLLLLAINDGTDSYPICNAYELIKNSVNYNTGCKNFVDLDTSSATSQSVVIAFSKTGAYEVVFMDASGNQVIYSFIIDKTAPIVTVTGASENIYNGDKLVETPLSINFNKTTFYVSDHYTKNPVINIHLDDLIGVGKYSYKFYSSVYKTDVYRVLDATDSNNQYSIQMPSSLIQILEEGKFNGDVILYVYGVDTGGNGSEEDAIEVHFWVDYEPPKAPTNKIVKENLNENKIDNALTEEQFRTISVFSTDYSSGAVECVYDFDLKKNIFSFIDNRDEKLYTFSMECEDLHNNDNGTDIYSKTFANNIYMKFYESTDGIGKQINSGTGEPDIFNFNQTNEYYYGADSSKDGWARWIYITIVDSVGNESEHIISLPIFVLDSTPPSVEVGEKENPNLAGDYIEIEPTQYSHAAHEKEGFESTDKVYIANTSIKLTYSEPIFKVVKCMYVSSTDNYATVNNCNNYPEGAQYGYATKQVSFTFENDEAETTKIYVIVVKDFATLDSSPVIVVLDRTPPSVAYHENGDKDAIIEFGNSAITYDDSYVTGGYNNDVFAIDDQKATVNVYVTYQQYVPSFTYNNYTKVSNNYVAVENFVRRDPNKQYYLLLKQDLAEKNNKNCVAEASNVAPGYCYVSDVVTNSVSYYYFDSLLTDESGGFWLDKNIINNKTLGVYRITYYVVDYAGNVSERTYKRVFVNDTFDPDVNIKSGTLEYLNVTSTNDNNFQGKLNKAATFVGTDKRNANDKGVDFVLYKCDESNYKKADGEMGKCYLENRYLYSETSDKKNPAREQYSSSNEWNLGEKLADGIYKLIAYDSGGYNKEVFNSSNVYYSYNGSENLIGSSEVIYSRNFNTSELYFAINIGETGAKYTIHGNRYNSSYSRYHQSNNVQFVFDKTDINYYTISNTDIDRDVYLVMEQENGQYVDVSGKNAPWTNTTLSKSKSGDTIIYTYLDSSERKVYEVHYEPYSVAEGMYLHETYHNVDYDNGTAEVCLIKNGVNPCEELETVYKVVNVEANIYEDGIYKLRMRDRYGNLSPDIGSLMVDNEAYMENKNNNIPTGINYWFSVPSQPITESNLNYFSVVSGVTNSNIDVMDSKFDGNFNSDFFYAFASKTQAKQYLKEMYINEINRVFESNPSYTLIDVKGNPIKTYDRSVWLSGEKIINELDIKTFGDFINTIIYETFIGQFGFENSIIKQVEYLSSEITSSMYEYALLKITETINHGEVIRSYAIVNSCTPSDNCVKVPLRIVSSGTIVRVFEEGDEVKHKIHCRATNTGGAQQAEDAGCNIKASSGETHIFIDTDKINDITGIPRYHVNEVYFGVVAYSETAPIEYSELGEFVPLSKFEKYLNAGDSIVNDNGRYIWLDLEYVLIDDLMKTNLYSNTCIFNGETYSDCVYVKYIPIYNQSCDIDGNCTYIPTTVQSEQNRYYNYYDSKYYNKEAMIAQLQEMVRKYIPLSEFERYDSNGNALNNGGYIWINSSIVAINDLKGIYKAACVFNGRVYTDGCVYVTYLSGYTKDGENYKPTKVGNPTHYYNYYDGKYYTSADVTKVLQDIYNDFTFNREGKLSSEAIIIPIRTNSEYIITDLTKDNSPIITNKKVYLDLFNEKTLSKLFEVKNVTSQNGEKEIYSYAYLEINGVPYNINNMKIIERDGTYRWVIDIDLRKSYTIFIKDRAGNEFHIVVSNEYVPPALEYKVDNEELTDSNAKVTITTTSTVASFTKNDVSIYKYDTNTKKYVISSVSSCLSYVQDALEPSTPTRTLILAFKNGCNGAYKIEIVDNHGNKNYTEFVFNPYSENTQYVINTETNTTHEYVENYIKEDINTAVKGIIVNRGFSIKVHVATDYIVINKYAPYSNLNLSAAPLASTLTIKDFEGSYSFAGSSCELTIAPLDGGYYTVAISGTDAACDGVYVVNVYNRFADVVLSDEKLQSLHGANSEPISYLLTHNGSESIEIDTVAPPANKLDGDEQYFTLYVDDVENTDDTLTLLEEGTIRYTNKYITISWGGLPLQGFTYLKYRVVNVQDWKVISDNVTYDYGYTASFKFEINLEGVYVCEFMFVDAVGNEDANSTFQIIITIEPPKVAFYEVDDNGVIQNQYLDNSRIAKQTILKCIYDDGLSEIVRNCTLDDYKYDMYVNDIPFREYSNNLELADIISRNSFWLRGSAEASKDELVIHLVVSVKGKEDINTHLTVIIDQKAPKISFSGNLIGTTYTGEVTINIAQDIRDSSNFANIFYCDVIRDELCYIYDENNKLVEDTIWLDIIAPGENKYIVNSSYSGYFIVVAEDDLGNSSTEWFVLDNKAPTIQVKGKDNSIIAPGMYTNSSSVYVDVLDDLSKENSTFTIEFTPLDSKESSEVTYNPLTGLTKEGKYTLIPKDGVNIEGRGISFYIYRKSPIYVVLSDIDSVEAILVDVLTVVANIINGGRGLDGEHLAAAQAQISWPKYGVGDYELYAPIVSILVDGVMYNATYSEENEVYLGEAINKIGNHTIVVTDAAGNRSTTMLTINNTNNVCINGNRLEVKMQAYYNVNQLLIGKEPGIKYEKNDVIIFALPSQVNSAECMEDGLLGYRTLDPENSHYLIEDDRIANLFNQNKYDFVANKFISAEAVKEVENVGGTVVVLIVTKEVANKQLGYSVGTNFFLEDPIGWSIIFAVCIAAVWPTVRIFVKKKVRVI